jgi:predicted glycogen debranching enzyme
MPEPTAASRPLEPLVVPCQGRPLEDLLAREWLLANRIGAYASSTAVGCNTRRYHGLLVAATRPPMGRMVALSQVVEQLIAPTTTYDLATIEFPDTFSPRGVVHLHEFRNDAAPTFVFRAGGLELVKEVLLAETTNTVALRYTLRGGSASLRVMPFVALRDFHSLRSAGSPHQMTFETMGSGLAVQDRMQSAPALYLSADGAQFTPRPQWWYRFHYREDLARGQDAHEDLYVPGALIVPLADGQSWQLTASLSDPRPLDFAGTLAARRSRLAELAASVGPTADQATRTLAAASDAFVVQRHFPNAPPSWTILAGYHWFADWGRDTFVALPGLLLTTGRFALAREVFHTFASHVENGMVPNRFDDYSPAAHYNSIDASLWFIVAAERYLQATGDVTFWRTTLLPAAQSILRAYQNGTQFDIHADADGLLMGGSINTQLTWMDVKLGQEVITPRYGKCVDVNALWYCAHCILAERAAGIDEPFAESCRNQAAMIARAFEAAFWNVPAGCLFDCIHDGQADATIRPNQILAVSLPHSPLNATQQACVLRIVQDRLLTPMGLRTLDPGDGRYRRRYGNSWESRDRAYHQGTVWAWLMGPFLEAYLRVHQYKPFALAQARQWLASYDAHLETAGLGYISEIFDADPPHAPRGCIAQAWSVGEVLRLKKLVQDASARTPGAHP